MKHLIISGPRNVKKTEMIDRALGLVDLPIYGYQTKTALTDREGTHHVYIYPAGKYDGTMRPDCHVGDCSIKQRTVNNEVFDTKGVSLLRSCRDDGIIVMSEIGFMEVGSSDFCSEVLNKFSGSVPILATIKDTEIGSEYLDLIRKHPNVELIDLNKSNYYDVFQYVMMWLGQCQMFYDYKYAVYTDEEKNMRYVYA